MDKIDVNSCLKILHHYGLAKKDIQYIKNRKKNRIFVIRDTNNKLFLLKKIPDSKTPFSILLQQQLFRKGVRVPKVYPTDSGKWYVKQNHSIYFLSEYVKDLTSLSTTERIKALAIFHANAQFLDLSTFKASNKFTDRKEFLKLYTDKIEDLTKWKSLVNSRILKTTIKNMIQQGKQSYTLIKTCKVAPYLKYTKSVNAICHGDFNDHNSYLTKEDEILIFDFDQAYYGPPIEDFRYFSRYLSKNSLYENKLKKFFNTYFKYNQKEQKWIKLYLVDAMFPHEFHEIMKRTVQKTKKRLDQDESKAVQMARWEKRKNQFCQREYCKH